MFSRQSITKGAVAIYFPLLRTHKRWFKNLNETLGRQTLVFWINWKWSKTLFSTSQGTKRLVFETFLNIGTRNTRISKAVKLMLFQGIFRLFVAYMPPKKFTPSHEKFHHMKKRMAPVWKWQKLSTSYYFRKPKHSFRANYKVCLHNLLRKNLRHVYNFSSR